MDTRLAVECCATLLNRGNHEDTINFLNILLKEEEETGCLNESLFGSILFLLNNFLLKEEYLFGLQKKWFNKLINELVPKKEEKDINVGNNKKMRIGYFSADFRAHVVMNFFLPAIHGQEKMEIFCYSNNNNEDIVTNYVKSIVKSFKRIDDLDDEKAALMIKSTSW
jgi:predicted O-linked N-acetylglucosamine transferase (SPINDLY family)